MEREVERKHRKKTREVQRVREGGGRMREREGEGEGGRG